MVCRDLITKWRLDEHIRVILHWLGLFVLYEFPLVVLCIISIKCWCILRGIVRIWKENNMFWVIEGQTHFSISWHAKVSMMLKKMTHKMFFYQTSTLLPSTMPWIHTEHGRCCIGNNHLLTKSHVELLNEFINKFECGTWELSFLFLELRWISS